MKIVIVMMTCLVVSQAQVHRRVKRFNNLVRLSDLNDSFHLKNTAKPALTRIQDPIFNIMGQTPVLGYAPIIDNDFFDFLRDTYKLPPGIKKPLKEYDFIIVGAGSAGCVLANRLTEDGNWTVLLIEAGGPESIFTDVPLLAAYLQSTNYNWGYMMEKQKGICMGMTGQQCHWPKGKAVGGTSVINYMIYTRGNKIDWDRIAAAGNPGWSYDEVLPYFLKMEHSNLDGLYGSPDHGKYGPMNIEYPKYKSKLLDVFLEAAQELGNKIVDYNKGDEKFGFGRIQTNTKNGRRESASKTYLYPIRKRPNLHILTYTRATKIGIDPQTMSAKSVRYFRNGKYYVSRARKEVILSAGSLASPQLLMLSGIGPRKDLEDLGISVIKDLPVGKQMYDHICYVGLQFTIDGTDQGSLIESDIINLSSIGEWLRRGDNEFSIIGGVEGIGYIKTNISEETENYPDVELLFLPGGITSDKTNAIRRGMHISDDFYRQVYSEITEKPTWSIMLMQLHPISKGHMKLVDTNPFKWPKFYYDYFADRRDLLTMVEGIKYSLKLSDTKAFQRFNSKPHTKHFPTCCQYEYGSDEYWECAVRTLSTTLHHQIGTTKMGPSSDPEAVVDSELRVHGMNKLRVIDASVIPIPITSHTNAPTMMIAEKAADLIKAYWRNKNI